MNDRAAKAQKIVDCKYIEGYDLKAWADYSKDSSYHADKTGAPMDAVTKAHTYTGQSKK